MIRTQIQLPDELYGHLKKVAERQELSLAEIIRRAAESYLRRFPEDMPPKGQWKLAGPFDLGLRPDADLENLRYDQEMRNPYGEFHEE